MIRFEWDDDKSILNIQKHDVTFQEAQSVFYDENAVLFFDQHHSEDEERFILLGLSNRLRMLVVVHCFRESDSTIRLISARKATKNEVKYYGG